MAIKKIRLFSLLIFTFAICLTFANLETVDAGKKIGSYKSPSSGNKYSGSFNSGPKRHSKYNRSGGGKYLGTFKLDYGEKKSRSRYSEPSNNNNINWGDLFNGGGSNQNHSHPQYTQPQPIYTQPQQQFIQPQPQYIQPQPQVVQPAPQVVKPLANNLPSIDVEPASNDYNMFDVPSDRDLGKASDNMMDDLIDDSDELLEEQDDIVKKKEDALNIPPGASKKDAGDLSDAIADGDTDKVEELAEKMNLDQGEVDDLLTEMDVRNRMEDFNELANDGASTDQLKRAADDMLDAMDNRGPGSKKISNNQIDQIDRMINTSETIDVVESIIDSNNSDQMPDNFEDVYYVPGLPDDSLAVAPGGHLIYGTGGEGEIEVSEVGFAETLGIALPLGDPVSDFNEKTDTEMQDGVLLTNSDKSKETVNYAIRGKQYSMQPGYNQEVPNGGSMVIDFDRGGEFGKARYTLKNGTYEFRATEKGWELFSKTYKITIDNSKNNNNFNYVINNKQIALKAGGKKEHTSSYPLVLKYDRGDSGSPIRKSLANKATYQVGLDLNNKRIELFEVDEEKMIAKSNKSSRRSSRDKKSRKSSGRRYSTRRANLRKKAARKSVSID